MNIDELKAKYAAISGKVITSRRDNFFKLESNRPVTFFVLLGEFSSRGVWIHPIATHFLGRRYSCSNITEPNSCYICEQLILLEEELASLKAECEEKQKSNPHEAASLVIQINEFEKRIQSARAQEKYAFNILVKGEEIPRIFEAPKSVAGPIVQVFETVLEEENINIFDPVAATAFTVSKEGENLLTRYKVITAPRPVPILTGENREERIAKVISAGFNLDERYKLPSTDELRTAWTSYLNGTSDTQSSSSQSQGYHPQGQPGGYHPQTQSPPASRAPIGPVPMSRIGGRTVVPKPTAAAAPPPPPPPVEERTEEREEPPAAEVEKPVENNGKNGGSAKVASPTVKPDSEAVKTGLLNRLKAASVKK
jgi:hypothetical protein